MTAPKSLRELFDQIGLQEVSSTDDTVVMEMPVDERLEGRHLPRRRR